MLQLTILCVIPIQQTESWLGPSCHLYLSTMSPCLASAKLPTVYHSRTFIHCLQSDFMLTWLHHRCKRKHKNMGFFLFFTLSTIKANLVKQISICDEGASSAVTLRCLLDVITLIPTCEHPRRKDWSVSLQTVIITLGASIYQRFPTWGSGPSKGSQDKSKRFA